MKDFNEQLQAQADQAERDRAREMEDLRNTFATPTGRRVFWRILLRCHYLGNVSRTNSSIYQLAAERDFGLEMISLLAEADPDLLADILTMGLRERKAEAKKDDTARE